MRTSDVPDIDAMALERLLSAATAAPSIHNTQPWQFRWDPGTRSVEVRATPRRSLPLADPAHRAQYLSVGAALFNLRVAAAHLGRQPVVELLPDPGRPDLLATVRLAEALGGPDPLGAYLYPAIERRHTSRMPFTGRPVPEPVVTAMTTAARAEGAGLRIPDYTYTRLLLRLTAAAEARNHLDAARAAEARSWVTVPGAGPYGIPVTALGPQDAAGRMPMRDFTGSRGARRSPHLPLPRFERHAQLALLWTAHDRRVDWLRAGQSLQHALLVATAHGVRTSMLHQALEWPDLRRAMGESRHRHAQLLIRIGYGPDGARTPRAPSK
ncbi:Acg family FMN-binding oxidoreductase [Streptomyces cavernae]|uniref:Acg family FMN-binding oxidoreductase n=1 Tax=Streptomyces cavernae TaxID=2259034 RepID=UPI000FEB5F44|nr:hypothetical protein [Streptomyces cavernae]